MAIISRQTGLLNAENWKKVYQTFREADFTAYDFETLRKSMIDYVKINYPEDFNDFTESSEFIALIDLIAFFGQSLAFRTDLNARENFLDTAERRDSILKLARLISYNPKRNTAASGYLKIDSVSTTETVYDSDGINLAGTKILWDDPANENWLEQFNTVLNACLVDSQVVGRPGNSQTINSVRTDEYSVNVVPGVLPVFRFESAIEGNRTVFEAVSATSFDQSYVYEVAPKNNGVFNLLHRNDNLGNSSNNTGFFVYFKQGEINSLNFAVDEIVPNKVVNIDIANINNSDVWLYSVDSLGAVQDLWTSVPATSGINVIYNNRTDRNLYQINSRNNDQIALAFGDGSFSNIPQGNFRLYYRVSNGLTYKITPDEIQGIQITINYINRYNRPETLIIKASLKYTVANAVARETIDEIRERAPQQYYTQNRMVTGEDYNILPFTSYSAIKRVKAINRTSSGLSRYLDVLDTTGKYSSTNIYGEDGVLYVDNFVANIELTFNSVIDIKRAVYNTILPDIVDSQEQLHYYYSTVTNRVPTAANIAANALVDGTRYTITSSGTTNFVALGSANSNVGTEFVASNSQALDLEYIVRSNNTPIYVFYRDTTGNNPAISVREGDQLTFNIETPGNPFWIKTANVAGTASAVTVGVIANNGTSAGTITWDTRGVPAGTYYYVSQNQVTMSGTITVSSYGSGLVSTDLIWNLSTIGDSSATGYLSYNSQPAALASSTITENKYIRPGSLLRFRAPAGYYFNATNNLVAGSVQRLDIENQYLYAAVMQIYGDGTNNGQGNFSNGTGPVVFNIKVPTGAILESITPAYENSWSEEITNEVVTQLTRMSNFGLLYDSVLQSWQYVQFSELNTRGWNIKFIYNSRTNVYTVSYRGTSYIFHSPRETNFYYNPDLTIYDNQTNSVVRDHIRILKVNAKPDSPQPLGRDYTWSIDRPIVESDGFVQNRSIYVTYSDTNNDSVPDYPGLFEIIVDQANNPNAKLVFFRMVQGYDNYYNLELVDNRQVISNFATVNDALPVVRNYDQDQLFYFTTSREFKRVIVDGSGTKTFSSALSNYCVYTGRQNLLYQYRHNSPNTNRIDPSISNIIDIYVLTKDYDTAYRQWIQDTSGQVVEPAAPTSTELALEFSDLENLKSISDTIVFNNAQFKPVFGSRAESNLQATFKVVKNPSLNISDADIKTSVVSAINDYFSSDNWDFGEVFYFSELSAYLHQRLSPNIASIVIVPKDTTISFGNLYQINAEPMELIVSAATVDDIEIISALSATQLNQSLAVANQSF